LRTPDNPIDFHSISKTRRMKKTDEKDGEDSKSANSFRSETRKSANDEENDDDHDDVESESDSDNSDSDNEQRQRLTPLSSPALMHHVESVERDYRSIHQLLMNPILNLI
jgi:TATA-binding protein-associated factor Taf7